MRYLTVAVLSALAALTVAASYKVEAVSQVGRYAIAAWAGPVRDCREGWCEYPRKHGYYVLDTQTGRVIESKAE